MLVLLVLVLFAVNVFAYKADTGTASKKLDLLKYHNVGNMWLRVSNYGFFGSGNDITPQWPSLEYPGGSGIDYLYQGALWFGAKKIRRNESGDKLYWKHWPPQDQNDVTAIIDSIAAGEDIKVVVDTLTTVGFDGDASLNEFLPAYNPLEKSALGSQYSQWALSDTVLYSSIRRSQRRGIDDDGDGLIDEDAPGFSFPFRDADELPTAFAPYGGDFLSNSEAGNDPGIGPIIAHKSIWFPLGFVNLGDKSNDQYNFTTPQDDDLDGLVDEDGYPVSEQDYISYYYDYSPFGTHGQRDWGASKGSNTHVPLNVRVRQMSYQWSYEYIKNLVYVEFDITNMNKVDTLFDCVMGIYMDSDVGPQAYGASARASDDVSSYVRGKGKEFAYTYDADQDGGLTTGYVGSRVCSPDPDSLEFACWTWKVGDGPDDFNPLSTTASPTANEKYWLLSGRNPDDSKYTSLRDFPDAQVNDPVDTRYLFAFYGDQQGATNPTTASWNLQPGKTMKIVIAVFPGRSVAELTTQATWAATVYGNPQRLTEVVVPDTMSHYNPPEPPSAPATYIDMQNDGDLLKVYWDNRSEFAFDELTIEDSYIGYQNTDPSLDSYDANIQEGDEYYNINAIVRPDRAYRLRHDFQGYALYGRSGNGSSEYWQMMEKWDKVDSNQDLIDYSTCTQTDPQGNEIYNYGGYLGIDKGLPQATIATEADTAYYHFNDEYELVKYQVGDQIYGLPIYNASVEYTPDFYASIENEPFEAQALEFKNPNISDELYLALYQDKYIPIPGHTGQNAINSPEQLLACRQSRLASRYYESEIHNPPKGIEYYVSVAAWDRGLPDKNILFLESGKDANMRVLFPGSAAKPDMGNIYVVPNPYRGLSKFDGRRANDSNGDKSKRIWFVNLPKKCTIKIFTLAGDLVDEIHHDGASNQDIITISKAAKHGVQAEGIEPWDLLSKHNQIIASGLYLFSVKDDATGDKKVGKFVIIK